MWTPKVCLLAAALIGSPALAQQRVTLVGDFIEAPCPGRNGYRTPAIVINAVSLTNAQGSPNVSASCAPVVRREHHIQLLESLFDRADDNDNGRLDAGEVENLPPAFRPLAQDMNNDRNIQFADFVSAATFAQAVNRQASPVEIITAEEVSEIVMD